MSDDGPFFRMAAPGFSVAIPPLIGLPPTVDGTSFWLNEIVLLTALSILDATRPTHCDFEFRASLDFLKPLEHRYTDRVSGSILVAS